MVKPSGNNRQHFATANICFVQIIFNIGVSGSPRGEFLGCEVGQKDYFSERG